MYRKISYPYIKVFVDSKNTVHYVARTSESLTAHRQVGCVGNDLMDFILLDLSEYEVRLNRYYADDEVNFSALPTEYMAMRTIIYDIAELIKRCHETAYFFLVGKLNFVFANEGDGFKQVSIALAALDEVIALQQIFKDSIKLCFDMELPTDLSQSERYLAFMGKHQRYIFFGFKTGLAITATKDGKMDFEAVTEINDNNVTDKREQLAVINEHYGKGVSLVSYAILEDLEEFLFYELAEMLKQGLQVKTCQLCGKYFVLQSQHNTLYCGRIYEGKRTCKQIGNKRAHEDRVKKDTYLQEYQRIYKARHAKMERDEQKESHSDDVGAARKSFMKWSEKVKRLRKQYLAGEISGEEFISEL